MALGRNGRLHRGLVGAQPHKRALDVGQICPAADPAAKLLGYQDVHEGVHFICRGHLYLANALREPIG